MAVVAIAIRLLSLNLAKLIEIGSAPGLPVSCNQVRPQRGVTNATVQY